MIEEENFQNEENIDAFKKKLAQEIYTSKKVVFYGAYSEFFDRFETKAGAL